MFGIIGSGFGLYGHLPAIIEIFPNETVAIPERYCEVLERREELRPLKSRITPVKDEIQLLNTVDKLVVSTWPSAQEKLIEESFSKDKITTMVLEKPLATTPQRSEQLLRDLSESGKNFVINYSFLHCDWHKWLKERAGNKPVQSIRLTWNFSAHHYKNNVNTWKRNHSQGGGIIRFFGIHLLAMLTDLGFFDTLSSQTEGFSNEDLFLWQATFRNNKKIHFNIKVDSLSEQEQFLLEIFYAEGSREQNEKKDLKSPFSEILSLGSQFDPRVENLKMLYTTLQNPADRATQILFYRKTNSLWMEIEKINQNKISKQASLS